MARILGENLLDQPLGSVGRDPEYFATELSDLLELYLLGLLLPAQSQQTEFHSQALKFARRLVRDYAEGALTKYG
jgi:hypothetical protein